MPVLVARLLLGDPDDGASRSPSPGCLERGAGGEASWDADSRAAIFGVVVHAVRTVCDTLGVKAKQE